MRWCKLTDLLTVISCTLVFKKFVKGAQYDIAASTNFLHAATANGSANYDDVAILSRERRFVAPVKHLDNVIEAIWLPPSFSVNAINAITFNGFRIVGYIIGGKYFVIERYVVTRFRGQTISKIFSL